MELLDNSTSSATSAIKDFIESTLTQIKAALPDDARIDGVINIEMSTIVQKEIGGGLDIRVINLGADVSENQTQKITIPIRLLTETGLAQEAAQKAKAEAEKIQSEADKITAEKIIEVSQQPRYVGYND